MSRFFVPAGSVRGNEILVTGKEAHHILDVMRLGESDKVVGFDGTGNEYIGFIKKAGRKTLLIEITNTRKAPGKGALSVTLIQAIPKKEKMDYIVEKATELGASSIVPVITERTIPKWDQSKKNSSSQRWRRIAESASKQCGRPDIPKIEAIRSFVEAIKDFKAGTRKLIAALSDRAIPLKEALKAIESSGAGIVIAIGPEGDFTEDEIKMAQESRFVVVSLGSRVLRSDTAGLAVMAILNYEFATY